MSSSSSLLRALSECAWFLALALLAIPLRAQVYSVTTLAGQSGFSGNVDSTGSAARFNDPTGIAVDSDGTVYVADFNNLSVRKVTPAGSVTTLGRYNQSALGVYPDGTGGVFTATFGAQVIGRFTARKADGVRLKLATSDAPETG